ncbi:hypothetical protein, partial [Proteus mirabilis]
YRSIIFSYDKINLNLIKKLISIFEKNEPKDKIDINKLEAITPSIRSLSAIILINYIIMKKRMGFLKSDLILV